MLHPARTSSLHCFVVILLLAQLGGCAGMKPARFPGMGLFAKKDKSSETDLELAGTYPPPSASVEAQSLEAQRNEPGTGKKTAPSPTGLGTSLAGNYPVTQTPNFQPAASSQSSAFPPSAPMTVPSYPSAIAGTGNPSSTATPSSPGYTNSNSGMTIPRNASVAQTQGVGGNSLTAIADQATQYQPQGNAMSTSMAGSGYSLTPPTNGSSPLYRHRFP